MSLTYFVHRRRNCPKWRFFWASEKKPIQQGCSNWSKRLHRFLIMPSQRFCGKMKRSWPKTCQNSSLIRFWSQFRRSDDPTQLEFFCPGLPIRTDIHLICLQSLPHCLQAPCEMPCLLCQVCFTKVARRHTECQVLSDSCIWWLKRINYCK